MPAGSPAYARRVGILDGVNWLTYALSLLSLGVRAFALVDAALRPAAAYPAANKLTKNGWLLILGLALAVGLVGMGGFVGLFNIAGLIAAIVYLVDVRPAVRAISPPRRRSNDDTYGW
jgi:hypothetical protein